VEFFLCLRDSAQRLGNALTALRPCCYLYHRAAEKTRKTVPS
jgi:thiaminase